MFYPHLTMEDYQAAQLWAEDAATAPFEMKTIEKYKRGMLDIAEDKRPSILARMSNTLRCLLT